MRRRPSVEISSRCCPQDASRIQEPPSKQSRVNMSDFAESEFDYRGGGGGMYQPGGGGGGMYQPGVGGMYQPGPASSSTSDASKVVEVVYKTKKTTRGLFKKKSKETFGGSFERGKRRLSERTENALH